MEIFLTLLYTVVFSVIILKSGFFDIKTITRQQFVGLFTLKVLSGTALYFIYVYYYNDRYNSDIFKYFDDSKIMYDALWSKPLDFFKMLFGVANDSPYFDEAYYTKMNNWYRVYESNIHNDNHTVIRFNALVRLFSFGYYNVHTVFICFLSFVGLTALYKALVKTVVGKEKLLAVAIFLIPSVLFWGSGVLKEGLLLFGMGILVYSIYLIINGNFKYYIFLAALFSFILLVYTKFYIISILVPLMVAFAWCSFTKKRVLVKYAIILLLFALFALNLHNIFPGFDILKILTQKQHDFFGLAQAFNSGSLVYLPKLEAKLLSFICILPHAMFNTLLRPHFFDLSNPFIIVSFIENILLLFCALLSIMHLNRKTYSKNHMVFSILFVFLTFSLIGLTTPVLGAIVRYKVPALPFYFYIFILILDKEKLVNRFPIVRKLI